MANGLRIFPDSITDRQRLASSFNGLAFQKVGGPLTYASPLIKIVNNTNVDVLISWDGVNPHDAVPAGGFSLYDFCSDAGSQRGLYAAQGTQFYVKGAAGAGNTGTLYIVVFYTSEL